MFVSSITPVWGILTRTASKAHEVNVALQEMSAIRMG
jgi:hypothetical protein